MFARFFSILGVDSLAESYSGLFLAGRYFLAVYENSIGNVNNPQFKIWEDGHKKDASVWAKIAVQLIWIIWFLNQWFIFMILLNFVIAVISESYDHVMER
jgi:hypothetical protein